MRNGDSARPESPLICASVEEPEKESRKESERARRRRKSERIERTKETDAVALVP